ncbi:porin family protein [Flammeovirga sp. SJP92]|uniref:porin family protein n=1 Tax=Flammeovirga sp. SJP92 TaxID=1775430 RepID=UPI0007885F62|nr:porin family protein [Flammeovirga sp. SJP92]KXX67964.1 hypothetical protein AVL50_24205 [Flammeovirga sp. SJP92]
MKAFKLLLCIIILHCVQSNLLAQSNNYFNCGFKGGFNYSKIGGDAEGVNSKAGIYMGVFIKVKMSNIFYIQNEAVYSMQGTKLGDNIYAKYDYINFPVILKIFPYTKGFHFQIGPQLGTIISANISGKGNGLDVFDQIEKVDYAFAFGIGYNFIHGTSIDLRYNFGLKSTTDTGKFPNNVLQIGLEVYL